MLIGFKVKNFKSFKELQHFSLLAGKVRNNDDHIVCMNNYKILKFSGMFGANGSGKSNLILAISMVKVLIEKGVNSLINDSYYRGNGADSKLDSYFEYEIALNKKVFSYGFELNFSNKEIVSEWLIDMTKPTERVIFERDLRKSIKETSIKEKNDLFSNCLNEMINNRKDLFLKEIIRRINMSNNTDSFFDDIFNVYKFLMFDTIIIRPQTHKLFNIDYFNNRDKIVKILKALDINISEIIDEPYDINNLRAHLPENVYISLFNDLELMYSRFKKVNCTLRIENCLYSITKNDNTDFIVKALKFKHANSECAFGAYDESDGTIRILELIDILLSKDKLFLIDELDSSLHPALVDGLLKIYLKQDNKNNNQLIITTHELKTLNFDLVRRDEIWFAEKDKNGSSRIYSLEEFKDVARFDRKIDKAYMEGRFGAIAKINTDYED
jgi:AAA15 family ATPase/GTPase